MRRWAIWAANAVLFTLGCFLLARIAVAILAELALPARAEVTAMRPTARAVAPSAANYQVITSRNIFGAKLTAEEVEVVEELNLDAVVTRLPLELLGTVASEDATIASAAINDIGTRKHQIAYVGDRLDNHPSVEVHSITRAVVYLKTLAGLEKLELADETDRAAGARGGAKAGARNAKFTRARPKPNARPSGAVSDRVERLQQDAGGRSTAALYSQARIVPKWEDGKMVGVQLNQIKAGSLYEKIGIKSGDVITSLNGISIDSPQASSKLLSEFTSATKFDITMHEGPNITFDVSELAED